MLSNNKQTNKHGDELSQPSYDTEYISKNQREQTPQYSSTDKPSHGNSHLPVVEDGFRSFCSEIGDPQLLRANIRLRTDAEWRIFEIIIIALS